MNDSASGPKARLRRPCATSWRSTGGLKVPVARCGDGVERHVDRVSVKSMGPFHCLQCEETLNLRISDRARRHFAHRADSNCTGETALHIYAKALLQRKREFTFTPLVLRKEGIEQVVFEGGRFKLDQVVTEIDRPGFRPDAIVTIASLEYAIEFKVAHAVDEEKQSRVAAANLPMIEVDLNSLRSRQLSAEELDEAILHSADRIWIHHPERLNGQIRLEERVAFKNAERGRRLRAHIGGKPRGQVDYESHREALECLSEVGLLKQIGIPVECQHWFCVGLPVWQAAVLVTYIVSPALSSFESRIIIRGDWPDHNAYANRLPKSLIRTDLDQYPQNRLEEAGYSHSSFGNPDHAVFNYLAHLSVDEEVIYWDSDEKAFFVAPKIHGGLFRSHELGRKIYNVLRAAGATNPDEVKARWMQRYNVNGVPPAIVAQSGGDEYDELLQRVEALARMADPYSEPFVAEDLCGLSLEPMRQIRLAEIAARKAKLEKQQEDEAIARRCVLQSKAEDNLVEEAIDWLSQKLPGTARPLVEWAGENDANLTQALTRLQESIRGRKARLAAAEAVRGYQRQLEAEAQKAYRDKDRARLFVSSWHAMCESPSALRMILEKLPKSPI